ncbi:MAG TPA: SCP2 sterol-binding domain-containing protein [Candidatus Lokiarchaeia archaeon]|nr:SCP2 sterol-binding domain-containing protein [Candidatus Lokiarchaeia archaeon]
MAEDIKSALIEALGKWCSVFDKPEVADQFEDYNKTFQFVFPDVDVQLQMIIQDKKATIVEGMNENAEMSLEVDSNMFIGIANGSVDPMEAFMNGDLKPKGDMADLEKLQVFIED